MEKRLIYLVLLLIVVFHTGFVLAYIDPGTGGMVITSAWTVILTILGIAGAFLIRVFFRPIKKAVLFVWEKKSVRLILLIIIIFIILVYFLSLEREEASMKYKKVLVIGIDGMDPRVAEKLIEEGKLINFQELAEQGTFINLSTSNPPQSPVAWTSIATGSNPGKHGVFDFIKRNPETYVPELAVSKTDSALGTKYTSSVKADPFWRIVGERGISSVVIRWPNTFPPEKIKGKMLSGQGVPDIKGLMSGYSFYTENKDAGEDSGVESQNPNKIIEVTVNDKSIETELFGPKTKKSGEIVDIKIPMKITLLDESVSLVVDDKEYKLEQGKWSDFIKVKFKVGLFKEVNSVFKVYLVSTEPFEMFLTSIQVDPEDPLLDISYPSSYSKELEEEIGTYYTLGMPEETTAYTDGRLTRDAFLQQVKEIEEQRDKMFWKEFKEFQSEDAGVYAFVYDSSDRLQHMFWESEINKNLEVDGVLENYYLEKDKFIGRILQELDNDTLLLVVSDHGFTSFEKAVSMNTWLVENGFMKLTKNLSEIKPEEGTLFRYVDWENTQAYSLGFNSIYINVKGREGKGIVEDKEKVVDEIIQRLEDFTDKRTKKKVVNKAYRREDIYNGGYVEDAPDIIIGFNPGYRMSWQTAAGGFTEEVINDNKKEWKGDHLVDPEFVPGVLFSNVKLKKQEGASQMDVAPTILDALGVEVPDSLDGESLLE